MSRVIVFHGADHKCGTTQIAQCVAETMATDYPKAKVLLMFADGGRGSEYCIGVRESVDMIRPYLEEELIDPEEILGKSLYSENFYVIGGSDDPMCVEKFSPDLAKLLLKVLRNHFDVCIIDSGANALGSGIALGTLFSADRIYMTMTQKESAVRCFEWHRNMFERLKVMPDKFIINDYDKSNPYSSRYISDRLHIELSDFFTVAHHSRGFAAEMNRSSLLNEKKEKAFLRDIKAIVKDVAEYAEL